MNKFRCQICINLFLIVSSCALTLGMVEIALRVYGIEGTAPRPVTRLKINDFHSELGWWPRAASSYYRSDPYYGHFNYYNVARMPVTADFVDDSPDRETPTIAFIGDSFVEGYYVPYEKSFVHLVDQEFDTFQVINLGASGYNPSQYLLRARMDLPNYNVHCVIVGFFAYNDVIDVDHPYMQGYARPVFGDDLQAPINTPLAKENGNVPEVSWLHKAAWHSAVYSVIRPLYYKMARPFRSEVGGLPNEAQDRLNPDPGDYAKALRLVAAIQDVVPTAKLIVVYIPSYEQLALPNKLAEDLELFRSNCNALQIDCHVPEFIGDPVESFESLFIGPSAVEGHFSEFGSRTYANFITEVLHQTLPHE